MTVKLSLEDGTAGSFSAGRQLCASFGSPGRAGYNVNATLPTFRQPFLEKHPSFTYMLSLERWMRMHTMTAPRSCRHLQCTRMDNGDDAGAVTLGIRQASGMSHPMSNFTSSMGVR